MIDEDDVDISGNASAGLGSVPVVFHAYSGPAPQTRRLFLDWKRVVERTGYDQWSQAVYVGGDNFGPPINGTLFVGMGSTSTTLGTFRLEDPYPHYIRPSNPINPSDPYVRTASRPAMLPPPNGIHDGNSARVMYVAGMGSGSSLQALVYSVNDDGPVGGNALEVPEMVEFADPTSPGNETYVYREVITPFGGLLYFSATRSGDRTLWRFLPDRLNMTEGAAVRFGGGGANASA